MNPIIPSSKTFNPPSSYLSFPPEIRIRIYKFVLNASGKPTWSNYCGRRWPGESRFFCRPPPFDYELNLLLVSRQTFLESFHIYYRINTLYLCNTTKLFHFLCNIGYARRQQLVSIAFHVFDDNAKRAFLVLRTAKRLKRIKFILPITTPPGYAALREVRGMETVDILCDLDCSELVAAMKRPRLARFGAALADTTDPFKNPREVFPKLDEHVLGIKMNWTFGIHLCAECKKRQLRYCDPDRIFCRRGPAGFKTLKQHEAAKFTG